ncbi:S-methyl-5'-thioinosine phosphorylase [Silanimonas lenta]|uniref:S-methyl-5'-thioinosine phosphorylase n=1 Tax=Silanimonas lenta TaxID=265429 RepID=UPI002FE18EA0
MSTAGRAIDFAVIGGTGLYRLAELEGVETHAVETPWGTPSAPVRVGGFGPHRIAFLARHGEGHAVPPHRINYRANLWALKSLGATRVVAVNSVGGITEAWGPRVIGVPDQLIDYTHGRAVSFWDGEGEALHVDFGEPYTPALRRALLAAAAAAGVPVVDGGCYGATQGPRLETKAEIERLRRDGCDLVGMTGMPEAALARELGLDYACLAIVANWAAGRAPEDEVITLEDVLANMAAATEPLPRLLRALAF